MKEHKGVWLPDHEEHLIGMMTPGQKRYMELPDGRPAYQRHKFLEALKHVQKRDVFLDIGAHCGLLSMQAELEFGYVIAFEPHPEHARIYPHNMRTANWTLHEYALGDSEGTCSLTGQKGSSGDTHVCDGSNITMKTLDSYQFPVIDLMKIDTEGYELPILLGGLETLKRCRPVIMVEQKGRDSMYHGQQKNCAVQYLKGLGMRELSKPISGDYFMGW